MDLMAGFFYGVVGGLFAELLGLYKLRHLAKAEYPAWIKAVSYWVITLGMVVGGGALVCIYLASGVDMQPIIAVNIGASAPLILGSLTAQVPPAGKID